MPACSRIIERTPISRSYGARPFTPKSVCYAANDNEPRNSFKEICFKILRFPIVAVQFALYLIALGFGLLIRRRNN